jgi:hypothetical protein
MTSDDDWDEMLQSNAMDERVPAHLRRALAEAEGLLLQLAESGTQRLRDNTRQRCREIADRLGGCGLIKLGEELGLIAGEAPISDKLLRAEYLCRLYWQALANHPGA